MSDIQEKGPEPYDNSQLYLTPISNGWKELENKKKNPTPQGNLPMIKFLKTYKQESLLRAYNNVNGQ